MASTITINITPEVVREYFEGQAKVEAAKNKSSIDWAALMSLAQPFITKLVTTVNDKPKRSRQHRKFKVNSPLKNSQKSVKPTSPTAQNMNLPIELLQKIVNNHNSVKSEREKCVKLVSPTGQVVVIPIGLIQKYGNGIIPFEVKCARLVDQDGTDLNMEVQNKNKGTIEEPKDEIVDEIMNTLEKMGLEPQLESVEEFIETETKTENETHDNNIFNILINTIENSKGKDGKLNTNMLIQSIVNKSGDLLKMCEKFQPKNEAEKFAVECLENENVEQILPAMKEMVSKIIPSEDSKVSSIVENLAPAIKEAVSQIVSMDDDQTKKSMECSARQLAGEKCDCELTPMIEKLRPAVDEIVSLITHSEDNKTDPMMKKILPTLTGYVGKITTEKDKKKVRPIYNDDAEKITKELQTNMGDFFNKMDIEDFIKFDPKNCETKRATVELNSRKFDGAAKGGSETKTNDPNVIITDE